MCSAPHSHWTAMEVMDMLALHSALALDSNRWQSTWHETPLVCSIPHNNWLRADDGYYFISTLLAPWSWYCKSCTILGMRAKQYLCRWRLLVHIYVAYNEVFFISMRDRKRTLLGTFRSNILFEWYMCRSRFKEVAIEEYYQRCNIDTGSISEWCRHFVFSRVILRC